MTEGYRVIPPSERERYPVTWLGFDLCGMPLGTQFVGCQPCGVQTEFGKSGIAGHKACPICRRTMNLFTVTSDDVWHDPLCGLTI